MTQPLFRAGRGRRYSPALVTAAALLLLHATSVRGQQGTAVTFLKKNIRISGQASTYGELYSASGISGRRPPSTLRLMLTPGLTFSKYFSLSTNILLSTEGSSTRQNINILGLHPAWRWGRAHIGDYSDSFSRYTFNGVNVTGAEIDLFPGNLRFTAGGGRTKRAVEGILINESYDQSLFSARIGYGKENGSHLNLIFLKVKDNPASLEKPEDWDYDYINPDTLETELDTIWVEPPYNPLSVTPQENMVLGFASRVHLFDNRLIWELEGSGSAFSNDITAAAVTMDSIDADGFITSMFSGLFTPRAGSNFDFAFNTKLDLKLKQVKITTGYRYIGPGYYSLGIPSTVNDRTEFFLNTGLRLGLNHIRVSWNRLANNLLGQKLETNVRNSLQISANTATEHWRSQVHLRWLGMDNNASADSLAWTFGNLILSTHQSLVLDRESALQQIGLQYTYQTSERDMRSETSTARYHTLNLTSGFRIAASFKLNASAGLSHRDSDQETYTTKVYSLRLSHAALNNRLVTALFSSSSMVRDTRMLQTGVTSNFTLTANMRLTFNLSYNNFRGSRDYEELRTSIMLSRQF
ncbi:hypothetical protein JXO52_17360 [bacterium]|nr:hypothetical protein [bacterium]